MIPGSTFCIVKKRVSENSFCVLANLGSFRFRLPSQFQELIPRARFFLATFRRLTASPPCSWFLGCHRVFKGGFHGGFRLFCCRCWGCSDSWGLLLVASVLVGKRRTCRKNVTNIKNIGTKWQPKIRRTVRGNVNERGGSPAPPVGKRRGAGRQMFVVFCFVLLFCCCFVVLLLFCCCFVVVLLLFGCCFVVVLLLFCCYCCCCFAVVAVIVAAVVCCLCLFVLFLFVVWFVFLLYLLRSCCSCRCVVLCRGSSKTLNL